MQGYLCLSHLLLGLFFGPGYLWLDVCGQTFIARCMCPDVCKQKVLAFVARWLEERTFVSQPFFARTFGTRILVARIFATRCLWQDGLWKGRLRRHMLPGHLGPGY